MATGPHTHDDAGSTSTIAAKAASCFFKALQEVLDTDLDTFSKDELPRYVNKVAAHQADSNPVAPLNPLLGFAVQSSVAQQEIFHHQKMTTNFLKPPSFPTISENPRLGFTSNDWAVLFRDIQSCLCQDTRDADSEPDCAHDPETDVELLPSSLRHPHTDDAWQQLLYSGEQAYPEEWRMLWRMVNILEAGDMVNCIVADTADAMPGTTLRSELVCLLGLMCRQLSRLDDARLDNPDDWKIAVVMTTFTPSSVRVHEATLANDGSSSRILISKPYEERTEHITTSEDLLLSWIGAAPTDRAAHGGAVQDGWYERSDSKSPVAGTSAASISSGPPSHSTMSSRQTTPERANA